MTDKEVIGTVSKDEKVSTGHQDHITGTGVHKDKRTKRNRTRSNQQRRAIKDEDI